MFVVCENCQKRFETDLHFEKKCLICTLNTQKNESFQSIQLKNLVDQLNVFKNKVDVRFKALEIKNVKLREEIRNLKEEIRILKEEIRILKETKENKISSFDCDSFLL